MDVVAPIRCPVLQQLPSRPDEGVGGAAVFLVALELEARATITQVLFFKFRHDETTMRHHAGRATINASVLDTVGADIRTKVGQYVSDYIKQIPI